jgi:hypothetical protein
MMMMRHLDQVGQVEVVDQTYPSMNQIPYLHPSAVVVVKVVHEYH